MQRRCWNASRNTGFVSIVSAIALLVEKPTLMSLAQYGTNPHRIRSRVRDPAFASYRTIGRLSVGATFQLGGKLGVGYSGGIRKAILISDTSVSSFARPHMMRTYRSSNGLRMPRSSPAHPTGRSPCRPGSSRSFRDWRRSRRTSRAGCIGFGSDQHPLAVARTGSKSARPTSSPSSGVSEQPIRLGFWLSSHCPRCSSEQKKAIAGQQDAAAV